MAKKGKGPTEDATFRKARNKLAEMLDRPGIAIADAVAIANALTKMKAVELKGSDGDWGSGLGDDE